MPSIAGSAALTTAGIAGASVVAAGAMGLFGKNHMPVEGKTVLLTGASEGMGRSVAKQLAAQGAHVIVVARNVERLQETVAEMESAAAAGSSGSSSSSSSSSSSGGGQRFHYIRADVAEPDYAAAVVAEATAWNGGRPLDVVWCMAGLATPLLFAEASREAALGATRRNMDVNFYGHAEMAHAILREWLRPESPFTEPRHLVFTSSVVAFYGIAGYGPYAPSKYALRGLADVLAQELQLYARTHPVRLAVVYPGTILSPGLARENRTKPAITLQLEKDDPQLTPDATAAQAIRGLQRGEHFVTVSVLGNLLRCGAMGGSQRNTAVVDMVVGLVMALVMPFVVWWMHGDVRAFGAKHGHPATYKKE